MQKVTYMSSWALLESLLQSVGGRADGYSTKRTDRALDSSIFAPRVPHMNHSQVVRM